MSDDDGSTLAGGALTEEAALELVADETRARILKALGDATVERDGLPRLSYTELREQAGIRDSGRFNYHLSKLEGTWIHKKADGYKVPLRGRQLYNALVAGSFTADATPAPFRLEDRCTYCGHHLTARYTEHDVRMLVVCEFCGASGMNAYFPPNSLSTYDDPDALVDAAVRQSRMEIGQLARGQCYNCAARVDAELHERDPTEFLPWGLDRRPLDVYVTYHCRECTAFHYTTAGEVASYDARVVGFCAERGVDLGDVRRWNHDWIQTDRQTTVGSTDPWRVTVRVTVDGEPDALSVTLDGDASVVAVEEFTDSAPEC